MDEPRIVANQRLDLVDLTRWLADNQEALTYLAKLLGNHRYFTGAALDVTKRPLIIANFNITIAGGLNINVGSSFTVGGQTFQAIIFDGDGNRLVGPNSTGPTQVYTVAPAAPGAVDRYLIARHVVNTGTSETRQFYTAAAGKYSAATDTESFDDWEVSEALVECGVNQPASQTVALRDAGWIDIGTFQTNGIDTVTSVFRYWDLGTGENLAEFIVGGDLAPFVWTGLNVPPDGYLLNLGDVIMALQSVVSRMRSGSSVLAGANPRPWYMNPNYDACFDEEGGVRLAAGQTVAAGLQDTHLRTQLGTGVYDSVVVRPGVVADADDLLFVRAKGFVAGDTSGEPDTTTFSGYTYTANIDGIASSLYAVFKFWDAPLIAAKPIADAGSLALHLNPWHAYGGDGIGAPVDNCWALRTGTDALWTVRCNFPGVAFSNRLLIPIIVPDKCQLYRVHLCGNVLVVFPGGVPNALEAHFGVSKRNRSTGVVTNLQDNVYSNSDGPPWSATGRFDEYAMTNAVAEIVYNEDYTYWAYAYFEAKAAVAQNYYLDLESCRVFTRIREASHVY